jgi:hypothetical protein
MADGFSMPLAWPLIGLPRYAVLRAASLWQAGRRTTALVSLGHSG